MHFARAKRTFVSRRNGARRRAKDILTGKVRFARGS